MRLSQFSLEGRVALVTGAGGLSGMGRATAIAFADAGADVAVTDLVVKADNWDLENTADSIRNTGRRSLAIQADLTKESDIDNVVKKTVREFGTIDILANVAGIPAAPALMDTTRELWDKGMDINLRSILLCCQSVGRVMMEHNRGSIINWSSLAGMNMSNLQSIYGLTKIGIIYLTGWVARELAPYQIRCNAIAPGLIRTNFGSIGIDGIRNNNKPTKGMNYEERAKTIPLGRCGDAKDVADVALFLASDASRFITGHTIPVDGGMLVSSLF
jgi:3-oxoacyl-[acyl-carrier protein] reductase